MLRRATESILSIDSQLLSGQIIAVSVLIFKINGHLVSVVSIFARQSVNSDERISPCPLSSTLKTSMTGDFSTLRILHVPSCVMVVFNPKIADRVSKQSWERKIEEEKACSYTQEMPRQN